MVFLNPRIGFPASMVSRNFWHIYAKIDSKQPVQTFSQPWNASCTRRVRRPHLNAKDLRQTILRDAIERPPAIPESLAF